MTEPRGDVEGPDVSAANSGPGRAEAVDPFACERRTEFRRVFPLKVLQLPTLPGRVSRPSQQRHHRRRRLVHDQNDAIRALNWMAGFAGQEGRADTSADSAEVHALIERRVRNAHASIKAIPAEQAALRELLQGRSIYMEGAARANLTGFSTVASISLPTTLVDSPWCRTCCKPTRAVFGEWPRAYAQARRAGCR